MSDMNDYCCYICHAPAEFIKCETKFNNKIVTVRGRTGFCKNCLKQDDSCDIPINTSVKYITYDEFKTSQIIES